MTRPDELGIITAVAINAANCRHNAASIFIPLFGTTVAFTTLPLIGLSWTTAIIFSIFSVLTILGIELGLHRYFTHRSFKTGKLIHSGLALLGTWAFQSPISRWVADHRRHHRLSDQPYDTHSPYWIDHIRTGGINGLVWAHFLWMLRGKASDEQRYAADILADPVTSRVSRHYWMFAISGLLLPAVLGYLLGGFQECARCLLWAGFVRVSLLHQFTWAVNSIGHRIGNSMPDAIDHSRNNLVLAILTMGGGLHAYHHKHPTAAINHPRRWDLIGALVTVLETLGWIWSVRKFQA